MTPWDVLHSGTLAVSRHLARGGRIEDDFGVIAPGARADLVLLEENPLEDIGATRSIAAVVHAGRVVTAEDIAAPLEEVAARRAAGE